MNDMENLEPKMVVMAPTVVNMNVDAPPGENVSRNQNRENLCDGGNYRDCDDYNTVFCRQTCEFGPKEEPDYFR